MINTHYLHKIIEKAIAWSGIYRFDTKIIIERAGR